MKKHIKILPIILSIIIVFNSFLDCTFVVYASKDENFGNPYLDAAYWLMEDVSTSLIFLINQLGAIVDHDFTSWCENLASFDNYWNEDNISVSDDGKITFSDDLVKFIKQALKEYAEETNGFIILPSIHFSTISPSSFGSSYQYQTVKALVNEYGLLGLSSDGGFVYIKGFSEYVNNNAGFYIGSNYSTYYYLILENFLTWSSISYPDNQIRMSSKFEKVIHSWDEAKSSASPSDGLYYYSASDKLEAYGNVVIYKPGYAVYSNGTNRKLVSKDGRNILIFKNKAALENYTVEHRSVYFGSKFYEDTGSVTGSWDDLKDWLDGKYGDFWGKLEDILSDKTTIPEYELEKIIDKLLDGLDEIGDKIEEGNQQTNNLLQQILNALNKLDATVASSLSGSGSGFDTSGIESYLARILADLDYMVYQMEETSEDEFSQKTDEMLDQVQYTFADLGEIAKTKFPLSVPWDIQSLLGFLGGKNSNPPSEAMVLDSFESDDFIIIDTSSNDEISLFTAEPGDGDDKYGGGGGSDHKGDDGDERLSVYVADVISSSGAFMSSDGDPIFALPFLVSKSLDVKGTVYIRMSKFKFVSQLGRTLFTCIFAMYLIRLTFNVVSLGKDVFE